MKDFFSKNWKQYTIWLIAVAASAFLAWQGLLKDFILPPIPTPVFNPIEYMGPDGTINAGWVKDDDAVKAVADTLPFRVFADTPAGRQAAELPDHFYQWEVYRKQDPRGPPLRNQGPIGSCVGNGTASAAVRTLACQIVLNGTNEELKDVSVEAIYGGSRVEIGKGRLGRGDGSVGAWAAKWVQEYGLIPAEKVTGTTGKVYDLSSYDVSRCRDWGNRGVPDDLEPLAKSHPIKDITLVKTVEELKKAIAQGYGVAVCSDQGFAMQRDARGIAQPRGSWAHCMCFDGYHVEGGRLYFHIENSWGPSAMTGPVGWGNPDTGGFWVESATAQRMLNAGDTWALSGAKGFPARDSEWFVRVKDIHREADIRLARSNFLRGVPCDLLLSLAP